MDSFVIRSATPADIPAMFRISLTSHQVSYGSLIPPTHRSLFDKRYTDSPQSRAIYFDIMHKRMRAGNWDAWVAEREDGIVGYTIVCCEGDTLIGKGLFVDPQWHGQGIGTALFKRVLSTASHDVTRMQLLVLKGNARAKALYVKQGFKEQATDAPTFFGAKQIVMERVTD